MKSIIPITIAATYALILRLTFGILDNFMEIMGISFLYASPIIIGFLTIIFQAKGKNISRVKAFFLPWLSSLVIMIITIAFNIEGTICWILLFPIFAVMAGVGGLIARGIRNRKKGLKDDKPSTLNISFLLFIPIILGYIEGENGQFASYYEMQEEIIIDAEKSAIWNQIVAKSSSNIEKPATALLSILDFPEHRETTLDSVTLGGKRMVYYERDLFFTETITAIEKEKLLLLKVDVDPDKIPPTVMDEHILIGGEHLDMIEDKYELETMEDGRVKVSLSSKFYMNTPFNWYAEIWAKQIMSEILSRELKGIENGINN